MPVVNDREYRAMSTPLMIIDNGSKRLATKYYAEGYATTFNSPYVLYEYDGIEYYEVVDRNALDGADLSDIIFQYDHSGKVLARGTNGTLGIEADNKGVFIYADLSLSRAAKDLHEEIRNKLITGMSWAFKVLEDEYDYNTRTRTITKMKKVFDVSAASRPYNADTEIAARSFVDGVIGKEKQELLVRQHQLLLLKAKL